MAIEKDVTVTKALIEHKKDEIDKKVRDIFGGKWHIMPEFTHYPLAQASISLLSETLGYENLTENVAPDLLETIKDRSIKKKTNYNTDMSFTLEIAQKNLQESLVDRKIIVKEFMMSRF